MGPAIIMNADDHMDVKVMMQEKIRSDPFADHMEMRFNVVRPGYALVEMPVPDHLCNFHGGAHGAAIFAVADVAFSAASNAGGTTSVALSVTITYIKAAAPGSILTAEAVEESAGNRTRLYRVRVVDDKDNLIAIFEGLVYRKGDIPRKG